MSKPTTDPQFFTAPDGTEMAVVTRARLEQLLAIEEDFEDIEAIAEARASLAEDGGIPLDVDRAIAAGTHPIAAWRKFRGMTQKMLGEAADLTQAAVARLEKAEPGAGKPETLARLAAALDAPGWTLGPRAAEPVTMISGDDDGAVFVRVGSKTGFGKLPPDLAAQRRRRTRDKLSRIAGRFPSTIGEEVMLNIGDGCGFVVTNVRSIDVPEDEDSDWD